MKRKANLLFSLLLVLSSSLFAQKIVRVIPGYVLIDTDQNLGEVGDQLKVYRQVGDSLLYIGRLQIVKFADQNTAARKIYVAPGQDMAVGDFVRFFHPDETSDPLAILLKKYQLSKTDNRPLLEEKDRFGLRIGALIPASNMEYRFKSSFNLGGMAKLFTFERHRFFLDASLPILQMEPVGGLNMKSSLLAIQLVDHIRAGRWIHYDLGGGFYHLTSTVNVGGTPKEMKDSGFGFFIGFSLDYPTRWPVGIYPAIRYHFFQTELDWKEFITAGLTFFINRLDQPK